MVFFSSILIVQEIAVIANMESLTLVWKRNFGFLFGVHGKSSYHVFNAILPSGLVAIPISTPCGITVGVWGILHTLWYYKYPHHFVKHVKYDPKHDE
jgi:hypothetical protein